MTVEVVADAKIPLELHGWTALSDWLGTLGFDVSPGSLKMAAARHGLPYRSPGTRARGLAYFTDRDLEAWLRWRTGCDADLWLKQLRRDRERAEIERDAAFPEPTPPRVLPPVTAYLVSLRVDEVLRDTKGRMAFTTAGDPTPAWRAKQWPRGRIVHYPHAVAKLDPQASGETLCGVTTWETDELSFVHVNGGYFGRPASSTPAVFVPGHPHQKRILAEATRRADPVPVHVVTWYDGIAAAVP